jgi:hypothetical protein
MRILQSVLSSLIPDMIDPWINIKGNIIAQKCVYARDLAIVCLGFLLRIPGNDPPAQCVETRPVRIPCSRNPWESAARGFPAMETPP